MPLRKCAACGRDLPAGATARAKFCSATCRQRGHRSTGEAVSLSIVPTETTPGPADDARVPSTRLAALEESAALLVALLKEADPRTGAALHKEYRETLRELESARAEAKAAEGGARERTGGRGRSFNASAI